MTQPFKPAAYLKAAAKILRLQRALSRSKGSKSKDSSSSSLNSISVPCSPTTPSFQHSNGRRLSYSQHHYSSQTLHHYHHNYEHHHDSIYTIQRRRTANPQASSSTLKPDLILYTSGPSSTSKLTRRSGPPGPVVTFHHPSPAPTLTRSKSMPLRRRKRVSYSYPVPPANSPSQPTSGPTNSETPCLPTHKRSSCGTYAKSYEASTTSCETTVSSTDTAAGEHEVLDKEQQQKPGNLSTTNTTSTSRPTPMGALTSITPSRPPLSILTDLASKSLRSQTRSSLSQSDKSSVFSTTMPLADSSMSIQSRLSESSLLSAAMSASGLPSMDVMMDQVDKSIAMDSWASLVENAHVGLAEVLVVDSHLIAEPCSATIETWVN